MTEPGFVSGKGERLGAYEIQGSLGRGGMGEVFLAWDDRLKRQVAIKRIRHDHGLDSVLRQRLLREARAVAGLSHPAVVQIHDLIEDAAGDCIVLEYVEGRTLAATLAEAGPLEPPVVVRLAREIAEGLAAAHAAGIVHRDLKSENVIVTPAGHAKILDFGLARMRFQTAEDAFVTQRGVLLGTFHTMSPEQASGDEADERSDLFSLGVLLYEMLTGRSPFRGPNPVETLSRVLSEEPPRVDTIRQGVPRRLGDLVERLLAKEPEDRPGGATHVVQELEAVAASLASSAAPTLMANVDDLPTVVEIPRLAASRPVPSPSKDSGSAADLSTPGHPGRKRVVASLVAITVLVGLFSLVVCPLIIRRWGAPATTAPLRVLVLPPQVNGHDERLRLAALGVRITSLSTLGWLERVDTIDPVTAKFPGQPATTKEMAQAHAANDVLVAALEEVGGRGQITLTRQDANGRRLWQETIDASIETGDLIKLAGEVDKSLLRGYKGLHLRPGAPTLEARTEDYATFLSVRQKLDTGAAVPSEEHLDKILQVMEKSPNFLDARLLAADILLTRFQSTHQDTDGQRALRLIEGSLKTAPGDPRPLFTRFGIELAQGDLNAAEKDLKRIELLIHNDPRVLVLRSSLEESRGDLDEAIDDLERAVDTAPTWQDLNHLATLEARAGHIGDARNHLQQLLDNSPGNIYALDSLASIELVYGDLKQAEKRYRELIARPNPLRAHFTNLGIVLLLQGRYDEAIEELKKALAMDLRNVDVTVNLAEAEHALGRKQDSGAHFRQALREIEKNPVPENRLAKAECLAYLGQGADAVDIIQTQLAEKRDDPDVLKSAALIYALVGDRASARNQVRKAIQKGMQPRWFDLPGFGSLRDDPEFRALTNKAPEAVQ